MRLLPILMGVTLLTATVAAQDTKPNEYPNAAVVFAKIDLTNGKTLRNVIIKSYDAKSDALLVLADNKAMSIPLQLIPNELRTVLRGSAPESGGTVSVSPTPPAKPSEPTPQGTPPKSDATAHEPTPPPARESNPQAEEQAMVSAHRGVALAAVVRHFRYEHQYGPAALRVDSVDVDATPTRSVPGWVGRYETAGTAYVEYFDSSSRSLGRAKCKFQVQTEQVPNEELKVVNAEYRN